MTRRHAVLTVSLLLSLATPPVSAQTSATALDLEPGTTLAARLPLSFVELDERVYFSALERWPGSTEGFELWTVDPATDEIDVAVRLGPGGRSGFLNLVPFDDRVLFTSEIGQVGITDGTPDGTTPLPPARLEQIEHLGTTDGGLAVFSADHETDGTLLTVTDGTVDGSRRLIDLSPDARDTFVRSGGSLGDEIVFFADREGQGIGPWVTDGTPAGTGPIDLEPGSGMSYNSDVPPFALPSAVLFLAQDGRLWRTDGTGPGTALVDDGPFNDVRWIGALGAEAFLMTRRGGELELQRTDGRPNHLELVAELEGPWAGGDGLGTALDEWLYFSGPSNDGLWRTDGVGVELVADIDGIDYLASVDRRVVVSAGRLWAVAPESLRPVSLATFTATSAPYLVGQRLYFRSGGWHLAWTDGTPAGTALRPIEVGASSQVGGLSAHLGYGFFATQGTKLTTWRTDGSVDGTVRLPSQRLPRTSNDRTLFHIGPHWSGDLSSSLDAGETWQVIHPAPANETTDGFRHVGERSEFVAFRLVDSKLEATHWASDGTVAGTVPLSAALPATVGREDCISKPFCEWPFGRLAEVGDYVIVGAGTTLWSRGPDGAYTQLRSETEVSGEGFFLLPGSTDVVWLENHEPSPDGNRRTEVWKTDGTPDGTSPVHILNGIVAHGAFAWRLGDRLLVDGVDPVEHLTEPLVLDLVDGGVSSLLEAIPRFDFFYRRLAELGSRLVFRADTPENGSELWITDGTLEGTELLADILPGPLGSGPDHFVQLDGLVLFTATDPELGRELWATNGASTWLLEDVATGPESSDPIWTAASGDLVVFVATTPSTGREPFVLRNPVTVFEDGFETGDLSGWDGAFQ